MEEMPPSYFWIPCWTGSFSKIHQWFFRFKLIHVPKSWKRFDISYHHPKCLNLCFFQGSLRLYHFPVGTFLVGLIWGECKSGFANGFCEAGCFSSSWDCCLLLQFQIWWLILQHAHRNPSSSLVASHSCFVLSALKFLKDNLQIGIPDHFH